MTRKDTAPSKKSATPRCRLCCTHRRYNDETVAAIRESDRIMSEIVSGQRKPLFPVFNRKTLAGFRRSDAEIEADLESRRAGGPGTMKAYASLDELFASLHAL